VADRGTASNLGIHVYGLAAAALGAIQLVWGDFSTIWHPVQPGVPYRTALVYIVGVCLIVAGATVQWRRTARLGLPVLAVLSLLAALLWVRRVIGYPQLFGTWSGFAEQLVPAVAAVVGFAALDARGGGRLLTIGRVAFGMCVVTLGLAHFFALKETAAMVPAWAPPGQRFWAMTTGLAMLLAGVSIGIGVLAPLSARLLAALLGSFALFVWVPRIQARPDAQVSWGGTMITLAVAGAAWMVADALARCVDDA
jgi:uncharacterized membrane protein